MYDDELERAAGVRPRGGMSALGWIGVGLAVVMLVGATGTWFAYRFVRAQVQEVVDRFDGAERGDVAPLVARTVARTLGEMGAAGSMDADELTAAVARTLGAPRTRGPASDEGVDGFLRIRTGEGEFTADLQADDQGGSLVVRRPDGEVILDLSADADGGELVIRADGEQARFGAGRSADGPPSWLPAVDDRAADLQRVVSGRAGSSSFGALTWTSRRPAEVLVADYRERLEAEGWEIRAEHELRGRDEGSASVVGHRPSDGRTVLLAATRETEGTRVVLGWGVDPDGRRP